MRCRRLAEQCGELVLRIVVEVFLIPEKDHFVFEQCLPDQRNSCRVEVRPEPDTVDAGADMAAESNDGCRWRSRCFGILHEIDGHEGPFAGGQQTNTSVCSTQPVRGPAAAHAFFHCDHKHSTVPSIG